ncbi:hypothetical protein AX016_0781 [Cellulophaga sp. RHA19]|nr:hypothetical protein AX016_0781 [Cellulophaga sp. RHA19]
MALSYLDKAIIFLLPLIVLYFFKDKTVYVTIEYIYSVTVVVIPLLDFGLSGYFFYAYRNSKNHEETIKIFVSVFKRLYLLISLTGILFITIHYCGFEFEKYIIFIVFRLLFVLATTFLASYFRLNNKPEKAVYITLFSNFLSLLFLFGYFFSNSEFSLWLIFFGQIFFSLFYFFKSIIDIFFSNSRKFEKSQIYKLTKKALLFSWPSIIQVFIMMSIVNYGKINVLTKMTLDDGVLLSLVQRLSMVLFLTHSSLWAFLIKDVYVDKNLLVINKGILLKYMVILTFTFLMILMITGVYLVYSYEDLSRVSFISFLIIGQTFLACIYAYLELHYGRENKNIIKLYLALFSGSLFVVLLIVLNMSFLERFSIAMFVSTLTSLLLSIFVLYKRNYKLA